MSKQRRELLKEVSSIVVGGSVVPLSAFEVRAKSPSIQSTKSLFIEYELELEDQPDIPSYATCLSHQPYQIETDSKGGSRAVFANYHEPNLQAGTSTVVTGSHQKPISGRSDFKVQLGSAPVESFANGGSRELDGYKLSNPLDITATPGRARLRVGDEIVTATRGENVDSSINTTITDGQENKMVPANLTLRHHGQIEVLSHPRQLLFPQTAKSKQVAQSFAENRGKSIEVSDEGRRVVAHESHGVLGIPADGGGS